MLIDSHVNLHAPQFADDREAVIDRARAAGIAPLLHYVTIGAAQGRDPHPLLDGAWYARQTRGRLRGVASRLSLVAWPSLATGHPTW